MSTLNRIPEDIFYNPDTWINLAPEIDWDDVIPAPEPEEPVDIEVTATAPTFDDEADTYTIPEVEGVQYLVDGEPAEAGTVSVGDVAVTVTVTAEAEEGYVLEGTTSWEGVFTASGE